MNTFKQYLKHNRNQLVTIIGAFVVVGLSLNMNVMDFQTNLFANLKSAPFDGTTYPVKRVPSWVDLSTDQWKMPYSQIPQNKFIDIPEYQPSVLSIPSSTLNYSNARDKAIRNAQVTYSVPYMGDYKLDGLEYVGSHLAVDIKIPMGTPIYAIANGVVIKSENQPGGYGEYIVLRHDNVPSINDPNVKTTYYSGYGHMSTRLVNAGDIVTKGQQIGISGMTGTATTPHVHFQIDNDSAPWHLYWPFTSKEASDAGLGFFEAINAGLGKDKAIAATISPLAYVQKYMNYSGSSSTVVSNTSNQIDQLPPAITTNDNVVTQPVETAQPAAELGSLQLKYDNGFVINAEKSIKVIALDKSGNVITDYKPEGEISIQMISGSATLDKTYLTASDFTSGIATFKVTPKASFGLQISVSINDIKAQTEVMQETGFSDLSQNSDEYVAVNFLKGNNVINGYPDGTFKPENDISRVEALKLIYAGLNKETVSRGNLEFSDTDSNSWYAKYVATAQNEGIVKGYVGNKFRPAAAVTKAEFVKMLVISAGFNASNYYSVTGNFADVNSDAWYANYVALAKDKNLLDTSSNRFNPNQPITRGEVAQILYKLIVMKMNSKVKYDSSLVVNGDLIKQFYNI